MSFGDQLRQAANNRQTLTLEREFQQKRAQLTNRAVRNAKRTAMEAAAQGKHECCVQCSICSVDFAGDYSFYKLIPGIGYIPSCMHVLVMPGYLRAWRLELENRLRAELDGVQVCTGGADVAWMDSITYRPNGERVDGYQAFSVSFRLKW